MKLVVLIGLVVCIVAAIMTCTTRHHDTVTVTNDESVPIEKFANTTMMPAGAIIMWNGTTPPDGWVLCDGQPRPDLGITPPDLRSRFIVSIGSGVGLTPRSLGDAGGRESVMLTVDNIPSHTHSGNTRGSGNHGHTYSDWYYAEVHDGSWNLAGSNRGYDEDNNPFGRWATMNAAGDHTHYFNTDAAGTGTQPLSTMPPYYALSYIMKC